MISLRKRERISGDHVAAATSTASQTAGFAFAGVFLLALFILSFCCRFAQASLLYSMHLAGPASEWDAPSAFLLLLPTLVSALPAGHLSIKANNQSAFVCSALIACALATANVLLAYRLAPILVLTTCTVAVTIGLELARVSIFARISCALFKRNSRTTSVYLVFCELAAVALAVMVFKTQVQFITLSDSIRFTSLLLLASSFLFYLLSNANGAHAATPAELEALDQEETSDVRALAPITPRLSRVKVTAVATIALAAAANTTTVVLLCLTIAQRAVASQSVFAHWSSVVIGAIAGCLFCWWPSRKDEPDWYLTIAISAVSSIICLLKPEGQSLFIGLIFCGFAASLANINCCNKIIKWRQVLPPGLLFGVQSALSSAIAFAIVVILEPKTESISPYVFVRALAIAQFLVLMLAAAASYIESRYLRSRP